MSYNIAQFKQELKKIEEWLLKEYSQVHTGRATPMLLDSVMVESYGQRMPLKNVASVVIEDPKTLRIAPWDKNLVKEVERAIAASNLGLSLAVDSDGLRAIFPMLTGERRTQLVKLLKEKLEDARISVRKERESALSEVKDLELPKDTEFRVKEDIQKVVDEINGTLESIFSKKENEVMN
ncbi:MAG: ribosome recycling factor [Patescibacteria group bacterium]|jgi:ribosome recycling factor|nr:ribosome recycling factor [Patescibacteria group bacterium]